MNQKRRRILDQASTLVAKAQGDLAKAQQLASQVQKEEAQYRSHLPKPLQGSSKAREADEALAQSKTLASATSRALRALPEVRSFANHSQDDTGDVLPQHITQKARDAREVLAEVEDALKRQRPKREVLALIKPALHA